MKNTITPIQQLLFLAIPITILFFGYVLVEEIFSRVVIMVCGYYLSLLLCLGVVSMKEDSLQYSIAYNTTNGIALLWGTFVTNIGMLSLLGRDNYSTNVEDLFFSGVLILILFIVVFIVRKKIPNQVLQEKLLQWMKLALFYISIAVILWVLAAGGGIYFRDTLLVSFLFIWGSFVLTQVMTVFIFEKLKKKYLKSIPS